MDPSVPSLYKWLGGLPALERLTERFYERVRGDTTLAPIFAHMGPDHSKHVPHSSLKFWAARPCIRRPTAVIPT